MIISIASGKGGTGKTTVATNLAYSLSNQVQLLDCDVEEPNAHLFLKPDLTESESVHVMVPEVDEEKCTFCRACVDICRFSAITIIGDSVLTFPQLCHSCEGCIKVCPEQAITRSRREVGIVEKGARNGIEFVRGLLKIGEAMSPPLIKEVRSTRKEEKITIIDAPPGTSCPVISAMKDTDFVLMVTEPTPFGLHDLKLAVEAVDTLDIPKGLVINRSDIGDGKVRDYADENKIPVLMEIPFDRTIAELYSRGQLLAEFCQDWQKAFLNLYHQIETLIAQREKK